MTRIHRSRRNFLAGLGASAVALPFVPLLESEAADPAFPTRIVFFFTPNGLKRDAYRPTGTESDFQLGPMMASLERHKDKLLIVEGVDLEVFFYEPVANDHYPPMYQVMTAMTTQNRNTVGGPSIDQFIAQSLGAPTPFSSLLLGVNANDRVFYTGPNNGVPPINDPAQALESLFGDPDLDPFELEKLAARRGSLLDTATSDLASLRTRVGTADRAKIDAHTEAIRAVERRITAQNGCEAPSLAGGASFPAIGQQQMDLITSALACDITRVAALQWHRPTSNQIFGWLGHDTPHHTLAHFMGEGKTVAEQLTMLHEIGTWYADQLTYLLDALAAVPEGEGTLLDNTVVVWCSEHGSPGGSSGNHDRRNLPYVLAGGGGGYFRTGRYVRYPNGVPNNDLYISLAHAMGLTDVTSFGVPQLSTGPLPELV